MVAERAAVGCTCPNYGLGHGGCCVMNSLSICVQHLVDHYGFAQFVSEYASDLAAASLPYRSPVVMDWSLRPSDFKFPNTFAAGQGH